ncbi:MULTISPECIES: hypothetical protein [unclassified Proteiniphilum]|uniref:hypothetical protein n=1 Tax=unclassified Proteiniphilum TaxID=2622718 RepID=UPI00257ACEA5|nr:MULTISPECIES: hypothetical protein [unclassified Proteiniphilum]
MIRHLFRVVIRQAEMRITPSLSLGVNEELQLQILLLHHVDLSLPVGGKDGMEHLF